MSETGPHTEQKDHDQYDENRADNLVTQVKKKYSRIQRHLPR